MPARALDEAGRRGVVAEAPGAEVGELQDLRHLHVVDLLRGVCDVVIVWMEPREPPERGNVLQHERKLIAAKKDIQRRFVIEAMIEHEADLPVFRGDQGIVVGRVKRPDEIQPGGR